MAVQLSVRLPTLLRERHHISQLFRTKDPMLFEGAAARHANKFMKRRRPVQLSLLNHAHGESLTPKALPVIFLYFPVFNWTPFPVVKRDSAPALFAVDPLVNLGQRDVQVVDDVLGESTAPPQPPDFSVLFDRRRLHSPPPFVPRSESTVGHPGTTIPIAARRAWARTRRGICVAQCEHGVYAAASIASFVPGSCGVQEV